jgi:hypothetical protein
LEHRVQELGAVPRGWRQWRAELFNPSWVVPAFWGLVGALLAFVITHFI